MNAHEAAFVEPGLDVADCQWTKQFVIAIENVRVVRVGMYGYDVAYGDEMCTAVALDWKMPRVPRWSAGTPKRRVGAASKFGSIAGTLSHARDC